MPFLDDYLQYTKNSECPTSFHRWCGIFCISAALGRRVFTDMELFVYYPNFYIVLVAAAGSLRKSTAIDVAAKFLHSLEPPPNLIAQKVSPEALIDAMRIKAFDPEKGLILEEKNEGILIADELTGFLSRTALDAGLDTLLTSLYDCKERYTYQTKSGGKQPMQKIFFSLLGGTTPDMLRRSIPESSIGSGVTRRMLFIYEDQKTPSVSMPFMDRDAGARALSALQRIAHLSGPMHFGHGKAETQEIFDYYDASYRKWRESSELYKNPLTASYADTHWTHVFKTAMCLAVNETEGTTASLRHLQEAEQLIAQTEEKLPFLMTMISASESGGLMNWIENLVHGGVCRLPELLRVVSSKITRQELEIFLETLISSGRVRAEIRGNERYYLPPIR